MKYIIETAKSEFDSLKERTKSLIMKGNNIIECSSIYLEEKPAQLSSSELEALENIIEKVKFIKNELSLLMEL